MTVTFAVSAKVAFIVVGIACTKTSPETIFILVSVDSPCQVTFTVAIPNVALGVRFTVASPLESVMAVFEERTPRSVSNETKVLTTGFPSRSIVAVNAEFIVEFAAILGGLGEIEMDAEVIVINVD